MNRDRASQLGLTTQDIALTVAGAMRGDRLPELRTSERELTMRLAFRESDRQSVEDLARVPVMLPDGSRTSLGAVAEFVVKPSDREIQRLNRLTTVVINANLAKGTTMDEVRERVEPVMEAYALPAGYTWKFGRGFEENDKAIQTMSQNMLLAVVLIFLVMASLFESALYPLSIITSIVFAIVGSIWFLTLTGTTITMMAMIGFMVLMGVVVNIGIVLIAHVIDLRHAGMPRHQAILQAGRDRLRPIMMTTLTTLLGMLPLAIGDAQVGGGGEGPGVLSARARDHRRSHVLGDRLADHRADVLRLVRRPQPVAPARFRPRTTRRRSTDDWLAAGRARSLRLAPASQPDRRAHRTRALWISQYSSSRTLGAMRRVPASASTGAMEFGFGTVSSGLR